MKRIFLLVVFIVSLCNAYAQPIIGRAGDANTVKDGRLMAKLNLYIPVYNDTISANTSRGIDSCYAIISTRDVNGLWYRECSPKRWVRFMPPTSSSITNITVINQVDSSVNIQICVGTDNCDTITVNQITIEDAQTVELISPTQIVICNATQCDTATINQQQFAYFFQNALTQISPGIVEFGGPMLHGTSVTYNDTSLLELYTSRDIGFPNYPTTRIDPPISNVLGTTDNGVIQSFPYINPVRNGLVSGGAVVWIEDYDYHISPAIYFINGAPYSSPDTSVTLEAADATYDRIDAFVVNEDGEVEVITGTPSEDPQQPSVDPETQILLTFALVTAATTAPPDITSECAYQENTEWTATSSSARINVNSTNTPCAGTKNIEATAAINGDSFVLTRSSPFDPRNTYNTLTFQIKSKGDWGGSGQNRRIQIYWLNGNATVGQIITINNGSYGFNATNTTDCQTISIPIGNFFLPSSVSVTALRFNMAVARGSFGWFIDNICLQGGGGMTPPTPPTGITSIGSLPPLFQTTTTLGATTFTQIAQAANTVFAGPTTGADAFPSFRLLAAADIPTDLGYYKTLEQLTPRSIAIIRGDLTRDTIEVEPSTVYAANGLAMRNDSTVIWNGTLDQNTTITGANFYTRFTDTRVQFDKGEDVTAANDLTLGNDGNLFTITGNTQINAILATNWQAGSEVGFIFTGTPTLKNNTAGGAGTATMLLAGRVDYTAAAGDYIAFRYDGTNWYETQRKLASSGGTYTFSNGITESPAGVVKLGGSLTANTTIAGGAFGLTLTGTSGTIPPLSVANNSVSSGSVVDISSTSTAAASSLQKGLNVDLSGANATASQITYGIYASNTHTGTSNRNYAIYGTVANGASSTSSAIVGSALSNATGVEGISVDGYGLLGTSPNGPAIRGISTLNSGIEMLSTSGLGFKAIVTPSSTNSIVRVGQLERQTSGTAAAGLGASLEYSLEASDGGTTSAGVISYAWTTATAGSQTSQAKITGVLAAAAVDILILNSNGSVQLRPITATAASAITPAEGMIVIVSDTNGTFTSIGFWGYSNGAWAKF